MNYLRQLMSINRKSILNKIPNNNFFERIFLINKQNNNQSYQSKRWKIISRSSDLIDSDRLIIDSIKRRTPKKKINITTELEGLCDKPLVALSTAEEYNLEGFCHALITNGLYEPVFYVDEIKNELQDEVLHFTAKYKPDENIREFFVFSEGSIVFWNMSANECELIINLLKKFEHSPYNNQIVNEEKEEIDIVLTKS